MTSSNSADVLSWCTVDSHGPNVGIISGVTSVKGQGEKNLNPHPSEISRLLAVRWCAPSNRTSDAGAMVRTGGGATTAPHQIDDVRLTRHGQMR